MSMSCSTCPSTSPLQQIASEARRPIIETLEAKADEARRAAAPDANDPQATDPAAIAKAKPVPPAGQGQSLDRYA